MQMKNYISILFIVSMVLFSVSCGNQSDARLTQQVDSLQTALQQRNDDYAALYDYIVIISDGIDSINAQEEVILRTDIESPLTNRNKLKQSLSTLKDAVQTQRERITLLEKKLANGSDEARKLSSIIAELKKQLEQKDATIAELIKQAEDDKITIGQLRKQIASLIRKTEEQALQIAEQEEVIVAQDQIINQGFVMMGTKRELKEAGILSGGFLKKKKLEYGSFDESLFEQIDIRQTTTFSIPSTAPKILTPSPAGSYQMTKNGQSTTLEITDPARFWSVTNFLVIQL